MLKMASGRRVDCARTAWDEICFILLVSAVEAAFAGTIRCIRTRSEMVTRQIGNYRVLDYVGSGAFGSVFKAEDIGTPGRIVAVKELHRKHTRSAVIKQRFFQEALAMARLDHPNLPRLYTFGEDDGLYYLVMEFVSGSALADEIADRGKLSHDRAVRIICQVLEGIGYANKNGIVHRDLKPENIILLDSPADSVKVLDFGIAKMVGGENLTLTGEGFGTPTYMSPERINGKADLDCRTDIYSVGIILFEMLTGSVPFRSSSTDPAIFWSEMRKMHESDPIPDMTRHGISPELQAIIMRATAKNLEDRYPTADEMLAGLRGSELTASLMVHSAPPEAEVLIDGISRGKTDETKGSLILDSLPPGLHNLTVRKQGYLPYKIDLSLGTERETELQVQLSARDTVAIPPAEDAPVTDILISSTEDEHDAKTAVVILDELAPGTDVAFGDGGLARADANGRATLALGSGTHELSVVSPSGRSRSRVVAVEKADLGSVRTLPVSKLAKPRKTSRRGDRLTIPYPVSIPPSQAGNTVARRFTRRRLAAAASVIVLAALAATVFFLMRAPVNNQAAGSTPATTAQSPANQVTPSASPAKGNVSDSTAHDDSTNPDASADASSSVEGATAQGSAKDSDNQHAQPQPSNTNPPLPGLPTAAVPPPPPPAAAADACVTVTVTNSNGEPVSGVQVVCGEAQSNAPNLVQGSTDSAGKWQTCGMTSGKLAVIRVVGAKGGVLGKRRVQLSPGSNTVSMRLVFEPPNLGQRTSQIW